jgi:hypothetical protein
MFIIIGIMFSGIVLGYLFRKKRFYKNWINQYLTPSVYYCFFSEYRLETTVLL